MGLKVSALVEKVDPSFEGIMLRFHHFHGLLLPEMKNRRTKRVKRRYGAGAFFPSRGEWEARVWSLCFRIRLPGSPVYSRPWPCHEDAPALSGQKPSALNIARVLTSVKIAGVGRKTGCPVYTVRAFFNQERGKMCLNFSGRVSLVAGRKKAGIVLSGFSLK
jgi:hypothetical protein